MRIQMPEDKYMATVKVGEKGQVVIPKEIRDMFDIKPGQMLLMLADLERGIAIVRTDAPQIQELMSRALGAPLETQDDR